MPQLYKSNNIVLYYIYSASLYIKPGNSTYRDSEEKMESSENTS